MSNPLTILITGCSEGGTGAALAFAFHKTGHRVFATARNPAKISSLASAGIETITLDVTSTESVSSAVAYLSARLPADQGLNMLVNNAAGNYTMPLMDVSIDSAKKIFNLNVWCQVAVSQAFLPLVMKAATAKTRAIIVNHTSVGARAAIPFQGIYNSSKAALGMLSATMRLELAPFGIDVVDLKTAGVRTNFINNSNFNANAERLPKNSIYEPAREVVEKAMSQQGLVTIGISADEWAAQVSAQLLKDNPPAEIWRGQNACLARLGSVLPATVMEGTLKKMVKLDVVEQIITQGRT